MDPQSPRPNAARPTAPGTAVRPEHELRVRLSEDRMTADLVIPQAFPRTELNTQRCAAAFSEKGVVIRKPQLDAIARQLDGLADATRDRVVRIEGVPARHGVDGHVEFERRFVQKKKAPAAPADPDERVDYYAQSTYINVRPDDVIARIVEPTQGTDGVDVTGLARKARPGRPAPMRTHPSIAVDEDGWCVAQIAGVLHYENHLLKVLETLEISGDVDFSTGNIDVECHVIVHGSINDRFEVRTPGDVRVTRLIEGATVEIGGALRAEGGMACKLKGGLRIGGSVAARYMDNVLGRIGGDLTVEREIVNCALDVDGAVRMEAGALVGSTVYARRAVHVLELGSDGGEKTLLALGSVPALERAIRETAEAIEEFERKAEPVARELETTLRSVGTRRPAPVQARIDVLTAQRDALRLRAERLERKLAVLRERFEAMRELELTVDKTLHAGVTLLADGVGWRFDTALRGPIRIDRGPDGRLLVHDLRRSGEMELERLARRTIPPARGATLAASDVAGLADLETGR